MNYDPKPIDTSDVEPQTLTMCGQKAELSKAGLTVSPEAMKKSKLPALCRTANSPKAKNSMTGIRHLKH